MFGFVVLLYTARSYWKGVVICSSNTDNACHGDNLIRIGVYLYIVHTVRTHSNTPVPVKEYIL